MDLFKLRDGLVEEYSSYIRSFIRIQDDPIGQHVHESLNAGLLWPDPLIQRNPSFQSRVPIPYVLTSHSYTVKGAALIVAFRIHEEMAAVA